MKNVQKTVYITREQEDFIEKNYMNLSKFIQDKLEELMVYKSMINNK